MRDGASTSQPTPRSWTYEASLEWLYGRQKHGIKLGLAKVERLLAAVGDPHKSFKSIHVAGTNGKGSVTRMLAETLGRAGLRVGATTSPHLISFTERVEVNGVALGKEAVAGVLGRLRPIVDSLDAAREPPTFFEVVTALAFMHFRDAGVAWAVVETGMGGRLDATNVLSPALTVITNVDLDHQAHLGDTVGEIAVEKAGIMKPGVPCVTGASGEALVVLKARSRELRAPMSVVGEDYHVVAGDAGLVLVRPKGETRYRVGLAGAHQQRNAAVAVAAVEALRKGGLDVPERALREALAHVTNPGRMETFHVGAASLLRMDVPQMAPAPPNGPQIAQIPQTGRSASEASAASAPSAASGPRVASVTVLIDGAHNVGAAVALRRHLADIGWSGFHLVAGFCSDKQWQDAVDQWAPLAEHVWTVPVRNPRSLDPAALAGHIARSGIPATPAPDAATALRLATHAGAQRILVAGSLFLAGEARAVLTGQSLEEIRGAQ